MSQQILRGSSYVTGTTPRGLSGASHHASQLSFPMLPIELVLINSKDVVYMKASVVDIEAADRVAKYSTTIKRIYDNLCILI